MKLHESGEMYLKTILILSKEKDYVRSIDIAEYMGFSKPSVSRAISILKEENLISVDPRGHITLTDNGEKIASHVYEKHVVLSQILIKIGVSPEVAERDACRIEHVISEETYAVVKAVNEKMVMH